MNGKIFQATRGQYQISNYGDVKRLERDIVDSLGRKKHYSEKIFHPKKANNGYTRVSFGKDRDFTHRVVAKAFLPNPNNLPEVNHIDGKRKDYKRAVLINREKAIKAILKPIIMKNHDDEVSDCGSCVE